MYGKLFEAYISVAGSGGINFGIEVRTLQYTDNLSTSDLIYIVCQALND